MMTLCLYGGAFDPVHNGHIHFAKRISDTYHPDAFFFIPTCYSPFKGDIKYASDTQRLDMLDLALKQVPNAHISTIEIDRRGVSYTLNTLAYFRDQYPGHQLLWIIGADHLETLEKWKGYPDHFHYCDFIVLPRMHKPVKPLIQIHHFASQIHELGGKEFTISSTDIRASVKAGRSILPYVPKEINDYIITNKLYR